ncbi:MAG: S-layer homology domain-containing protein [Clostridiales bacterium]|nr:S-layer homology domain-containing protein [Clostridiales bacterium]
MRKRLLSMILASALVVGLFPALVSASALPFRDVPDDAWYRNDVQTAVSDGLVNGKTPTSFCPDDDLTYAEAVKLAACMHQKALTGAVSLANGDPWYQSYTDYAKTNGIIAHEYDWSAKATRAGYIEIFAHALPDSMLAAVNEVPDNTIPDVPMTHPQAEEIYKLYRAGILEGSEDLYQGAWKTHLCKPSDSIRRSEVSAILTRMMHLEERKTFAMAISWKAQYIRTNGYHDGVKYPSAVLIDSPDELTRYIEENKDLYDLGHKEKVYADTTIGFADAIEGYDAAWFRTHQLILVLLEEGSGSVRHEVTDVLPGPEPSVVITRKVPEVGTDDMAEWHILIEVERGWIAGTQIRVNLTSQNLGESREDDPRTDSEIAADFALRLFRHSMKKGENTLVSPLSVFGALSMTANGAKGKTKTEMETVLGMDTNSLNDYFRTLLPMETADAGGPRFRLANSVWFIDDKSFTVNRDFLRTTETFYQAEVFRTPFDDGTLRDINNWVKESTDGMIPSILDRIPDEAVMYLVNALAFDGEWSDPYKEHLVNPGTFTLENGRKTTADLMWSKEKTYLEDDHATGFLKPYKGGKYAFVALLPEEGMSVSSYLDSLDGEKLIGILESAERRQVEAALPKFETDSDFELSKVLGEMGMPTAFDPIRADFSGLGTSTTGNICINRVLHKTFISVAEQGTKAGAATVVEMIAKSAMPLEQPKRVILDRPFVYMLVDCETNTPIFIGALMDPAS